MLILDVLQSLVDAPDKMSKLKINIPSGYLPLQLLLHFFSQCILSQSFTHCPILPFLFVMIQIHLEEVT